MLSNKVRKGKMSIIGFHVFPWSGCQSRFLYVMSKDDNFSDCLFIEYKFFWHAAILVYLKMFSRKCYKGKKYFPNNKLFEIVKGIRRTKVLSDKVFIWNLNQNPKDNVNEILRFCFNEGLTINLNRNHMVFNVIEKETFW